MLTGQSDQNLVTPTHSWFSLVFWKHILLVIWRGRAGNPCLRSMAGACWQVEHLPSFASLASCLARIQQLPGMSLLPHAAHSNPCPIKPTQILPSTISFFLANTVVFNVKEPYWVLMCLMFLWLRGKVLASEVKDWDQTVVIFPFLSLLFKEIHLLFKKRIWIIFVL